MSSDLLDVEDDVDGCSMMLKMNVHMHAFLTIGDHNEFATYAFRPNEDGIQRAKALVNAIEGWIAHVKSQDE